MYKIKPPSPPSPPIHPGPPLPIAIPGLVKTPTTFSPSLYRDLFGTDLSVIAEALDAPWVSRDQRILASEILGGTKVINNLSTADGQLLDDLAMRYNDHGGDHEEVQSIVSPRLPVPEEEEVAESDGGDGDQGMSDGSEPGVPSGMPASITDAYGFTEDS